jgi:hypothetical protein
MRHDASTQGPRIPHIILQPALIGTTPPLLDALAALIPHAHLAVFAAQVDADMLHVRTTTRRRQAST